MSSGKYRSSVIEVTVNDYELPVVKMDNEKSEITSIVGDEVILTVSVENEAYYGNMSYQWYYLNENQEYQVITQTSQKFSFAPDITFTFDGILTNQRHVKADGECNGLTLRCRVIGLKVGDRNTVLPSNSDSVTLNFIQEPSPEITENPSPIMAQRSANGSVTLSAKAMTYKSALSYQWEARDEGENEWWDVYQGNATTLSISTSTALRRSFRCKITNDACTVTTDEALVVITDDTVLNATLDGGLSVEFVSGNEKEYLLMENRHTLYCEVGDVFNFSFATTNGNATTIEKKLIAPWKIRGYDMSPDGSWRVEFNIVGTFEYYGYIYAEYDNGVGSLQSVEYTHKNKPELLKLNC
ncbi:MAG: hypothetical protein PHX51_07720 [Clostridia bacterium]|nr:hypothetical protein [Clostridia bacterium]